MNICQYHVSVKFSIISVHLCQVALLIMGLSCSVSVCFLNFQERDLDFQLNWS